MLKASSGHPGQAVGGPADQDGPEQTDQEGHYAAFGTAGARTEMPGCSLCMGNQAQVREGATVMSTSTRNFPNRLGRTPTCSWARPSWRPSPRAGQDPDRGRISWAMGIVNKPTLAASTAT